ncbi:protein LOW PSII ACCUMULATION 3-like protein [Skeletonema marinoi]|uniref:Protein LOW PSII ACCUMULATION 3-like protein n=1 Tax=Skeletonema marinoi TaxID=267567 RepID=A0AAD8Y3V6_9STRA|nr:protein LOW PSII ACCUMULATION 3-like protein [Skeletonema marinoi]
MKLSITALALALSLSSSHAFTPPPTLSSLQSFTSNNRHETLISMNIPAPTASGGATPEEIQAAANNEPPPSSFFELQRASVRAAQAAINDGKTLLEVEFPPLPAQVLDMDDVSAYDVAKANVNLALDFARSFVSTDEIEGDVAVMLPDESECNIMLEDLKLEPKPYPGVILTSLRKGEEGDTRMFKPENLFIGLMGRGSGGTVKPIEGVGMYVIVVASAQELPDVEELYEQIKTPTTDGGKEPVIVFYNLKLDVLRGDLGAPAFPGKDFQDRFLSRVKPVYYLRTRQYSRSVSQPPFIINFQGCIFRSYPGHFQTLLDTGTGRYRKVVGNDLRPALGEFKEQLTDALREEGAIAKKEEEGALFGFLRTGYKTTTWWEDEREDASLEWRT